MISHLIENPICIVSVSTHLPVKDLKYLHYSSKNSNLRSIEIETLFIHNFVVNQRKCFWTNNRTISFRHSRQPVIYIASYSDNDGIFSGAALRRNTLKICFSEMMLVSLSWMGTIHKCSPSIFTVSQYKTSLPFNGDLRSSCFHGSNL